MACDSCGDRHEDVGHHGSGWQRHGGGEHAARRCEALRPLRSFGKAMDRIRFPCASIRLGLPESLRRWRWHGIVRPNVRKPPTNVGAPFNCGRPDDQLATGSKASWSGHGVVLRRHRSLVWVESNALASLAALRWSKVKPWVAADGGRRSPPGLSKGQASSLAPRSFWQDCNRARMKADSSLDMRAGSLPRLCTIWPRALSYSKRPRRGMFPVRHKTMRSKHRRNRVPRKRRRGPFARGLERFGLSLALLEHEQNPENPCSHGRARALAGCTGAPERLNVTPERKPYDSFVSPVGAGIPWAHVRGEVACGTSRKAPLPTQNACHFDTYSGMLRDA